MSFCKSTNNTLKLVGRAGSDSRLDSGLLKRGKRTELKKDVVSWTLKGYLSLRVQSVHICIVICLFILYLISRIEPRCEISSRGHSDTRGHYTFFKLTRQSAQQLLLYTCLSLPACWTPCASLATHRSLNSLLTSLLKMNGKEFLLTPFSVQTLTYWTFFFFFQHKTEFCQIFLTSWPKKPVSSTHNRRSCSSCISILWHINPSLEEIRLNLRDCLEINE